MKKLAPMLVVGALLISGVSFYGGTAYAKGSSPRGGDFNRAPGGMNGNAAFGMRGQGVNGAARMGGLTTGEILSKDDTSITVKLVDGGSKIVFLSDATTVNKATQGTKDDLTVGTQAVVMGASGTDGSVTATSVQIGGGFGFARTGGGQRDN